MEQRPDRRLTTLLAADVVGYSRLIELEEEATIRALTTARHELIDDLLEKHRGRIVNTAGDSLLMEFGSTVEALRCAIGIHDGMKVRNEGTASGRQIVFRMGLNVGDVVSHGDDLLGDAVNVAARLEGLAVPGGIVVSRSARDQIEGRLDVTMEPLGTVEVKNISRPIEAFQIVGDRDQLPPTPGTKRKVRRDLVIPALVALIVGLSVIGVVLWQNQSDGFQPASFDAMAYPLPDKPSIVVLPFSAASANQEEAIYADGITEDLITDLSKLSGLFVIARNSSFALKGSDMPMGEIAERLGVKYILSGGLRRAGDTLRINASLVDATTGESIWADRFDGSISDIFAAQDAFILKVVSALRVQLSDSETTQIEAVDTVEIAARSAFQLGWDLYSRFNAVDNARSVAHFEKALELDPDYGRAYAALALVHLRAAVFHGWDSAMKRPAASLYYEEVPRYLREAKKRGSSLIHVVLSMQHLNYRDRTTPEGANRGTDDARLAAATAIATQPNDPEAQVMMAWALVAAGEPEDGLRFAQMAIRLDPSFPAHYAMIAAAAQFAMDRPEEAIALIEESLEAAPNARELLPMLASLRARLGRRETARDALDEWLIATAKSNPTDAIEGYFFPIRWVEPEMNMRLLDGLRLAALPLDETPASLEARLDASPNDKVSTIRALGWFGPAAASSVDGLITALSDPAPLVRREAAIALGKIGPQARSAVPVLETLTELPIIGFHASNAIAAIEGR